MQKASNLQDKWWNSVFFLIALLVVVADQLTKLLIRSTPTGYSLFEFGFFRITHVHNTGAAFGLFQGQSFPLTIVALVGVALLLFYALFIHRRYPFLDNMLGKLTLGLVLGGTLGNLIDRIFFGYVTDFISVGIWPAFNIADSAITVGAIAFAYSLLRLSRTEKP
jgi:signal peptidase II